MDTTKRVFNEMPEKNVVSWNYILSCHLKAGNLGEAWRVFDEMPKKDVISWITMIAGYTKCGDIKSARELFDKMSERDDLAFNVMISCYAQHNQPKEALNLFGEMLKSGTDIQPDGVTLASVISACSQLRELRFGSWIESYINKHVLQMDDHMVTALIDLYSKCGNVDKAFNLFNGLSKKDVSYSVMIAGCAIKVKVDDAIKLLQKMGDGLGGHALDGCGEFMPSPSATPTDPASLKCAACGCHRNFHRRYPYDDPASIRRLPPPPNASSSPSHTPPSPVPHSYYTSAPHMLLALTIAYSSGPVDEYQHHPNSSHPWVPRINNNDDNPSGRKRARTKFSKEQKEKMHAFAERLGWRMQKSEERSIQEFCYEVGVDRRIFKVWMHNNKMMDGEEEEEEEGG
ncbi:hypothetical protein GQ457_13G021180 [Hibiscus cannabinus]